MKLRQASLGSEVPNMLSALPFADGAEGAEMSIPLFNMTSWPAPAGDCRVWLLLDYCGILLPLMLGVNVIRLSVSLCVCMYVDRPCTE